MMDSSVSPLRVNLAIMPTIRDFAYTFEFFTNYTKMPIVAFLSLLRENKKKSSDKMLTPVEIETVPTSYPLISSPALSFLH